MNPPLDARLQAVLELIQAERHADIGSDHAHLPIRAVREGRARHCVVTELNPGPLAHARRSVAEARLGGQIVVRQGDGFAPLRPGEVDSASVTGLGATTMLGMLTRAAQSLPPTLILQPNDSPRPLRQWASGHGFHLTAETLAPGFWIYTILKLERAPGPDPAYDGLPLHAAWRYGPHLLRRGGPLLRQQVWNDVARLLPLAAPGRPAEHELREAQAALAWLDKSP